MESVKYLGFDVHQSTISVAVVNADGKLVMQSVIATHAATILDFIHGLRGTLHLTFEEGTHSAWLYDLLARRVARVVVCNPRQNALLKAGNKSDTSDARKLAELLRAGLLGPVYHGEGSTRTLQELVRSYAALTEDTTRVMGRVKALYRSQAIACAGKKPYGRRHRREWLSKLNEAGLHRRAERLYEELDALQGLRRAAKRELVLESRKHAAAKAAAHRTSAGCDSRGVIDRAGTDAAPLPQQTSVLGLLRAGLGDAQQRRLPLRGRTTGARQETGVHPRTQPQPQSRSEKPV